MEPSSLSRGSKRLQAGTISRIHLENFMCHSILDIDLGDFVNFITGQNGSGKSAILMALCVAFGCRARGTHRANTLKDFIKTGCSYALVQVEMKNQGEDAFKHELYGDVIIVERKVTDSDSGGITLRNNQGRKIGTKKEDLRELVEYFNIDVENPCTIMTQDKSREFLHSGNDKDKFKFYFKATLLQQVDDLLNGIDKQLQDANGLISHLEDSLRPAKKELDELQEKIKNMEVMEEMSQQVQLLRKKLAWSWVYDADRKLDAQHKLIDKLKGRIPSCQANIDQNHHKMEELNDRLATKKNEISNMMERTSEVRRMKVDLQQSLSMAVKEQLELTGEQERINRQIANMVKQVRSLERHIQEMNEQYDKNTQAEESEMVERLMELQVEVEEANVNIQRSKEEEENMRQRIALVENEIQQIYYQIEDVEKSNRDIASRIREIQMHRRNKVTAFGGVRVTNLLQAIERNQHKFSIPPIGPIGAHVELEHGDLWAIAIETAVGGLLNAFIVTDHKDSRILRACAREANYNHLQIIVHDFRRQRINIPRRMLPHTNHPTALSVLHSDNSTVLNVLIDTGNAERQVLVKDYAVGKTVAFDQRIPNLKEVYTMDGYKMFYRESAQTIFPPKRNMRAGRLSGSFDDQIKYLEREASETKLKAQQGRGQKRAMEEEVIDLQNTLSNVKRRRINLERQCMSKEFELRDVKKLLSSEANAADDSNLDETRQEISKLQDEIQEKMYLLEKVQSRVNEAGTKAKDLKMSLESLCDSAKAEIDALAEAENELMMIERDLQEVERVKKHYEGIMQTKVLADLKNAETEYRELENSCQENRRKASIIIPEDEIEALGCFKESNPENLSAQLTRLTERLKRETQRFPESIDDLRMLYEKKERKISRKLHTYKASQEKMEACEKALNLRRSKFNRNAAHLKRQLTWQFNGHLKKKGISGQINVSFEDQTLSVEVKMPHDASSSSVHDTSGLSGGERSFSTLCFALALHEMTEAPFRAMDEFDVFMDAVSRKISLDAIVDFALAQGSQWIFITPHDISMVKNDERIKKQQMAAPRG
ncbi:LOW QUALITY PROTEIN: structural maintenance of chromosomes protein 6B-like [Salvia hispanica]|uniref:LOW QUALITY PROTEIN: structural maintenance of chromosomes protein 6B-like n=1 Tax=Salvia hispanica TaxID=49212 RepID=UPI0020094A14|nr:LOW QUALITY PROTEIN: structural maintenance of chromosomes protein 6B-like [Salvia hispanica]